MAFPRWKVHTAVAGISSGAMNFIPTEQYATIISVLPILCVDVLIINQFGEYLLVKRANEPKKDVWWPVGGRVHKGETLEQAVIRKVREETGLSVKTMKPVGYFEAVADVNPFDSRLPYHSVSVIFATVVNNQSHVKLDNQSVEWKYSKELPSSFCMRSFESKESDRSGCNDPKFLEQGKYK